MLGSLEGLDPLPTAHPHCLRGLWLLVVGVGSFPHARMLSSPVGTGAGENHLITLNPSWSLLPIPSANPPPTPVPHPLFKPPHQSSLPTPHPQPGFLRAVIAGHPVV